MGAGGIGVVRALCGLEVRLVRSIIFYVHLCALPMPRYRSLSG